MNLSAIVIIAATKWDYAYLSLVAIACLLWLVSVVLYIDKKIQGTSYGGYTCPNCKAFVPNGCTHSCPTIWVNPTPPPALQQPTAGEALIAAALNRLAAALEDLSPDKETAASK